MVSPASPHDGAFVEPSWDVPLDVTEVLAAIPAEATISGMFMSPLVEASEQLGRRLPAARERYTRFRFYPLSEHVRLLLDSCASIYPELPARQALRKLGRGAPQALLASTLGKVVLGSAEGPGQALDAMAQAYGLNLRPGTAEIVAREDRSAVVELTDVHYLLDCHHIGTFEGLMRYVGLRGHVRVQMLGPSHARYLIRW